jgi:hypothetical protein
MPSDVQLDHRQLMQLWKALLDTFLDPAVFEQMVFFRTGNRVAHLAPPSATLPQVIFKVIEKAQSENWLQQLVVGAHQHNPRQLQLRQFVATTFPDEMIEVGSGTSSDDPLAACFLSEDRSLVFIDRVELRKGLRELTRPGRIRRILAVHSDLNRCGKTYTAEFIRFVALQRQERVAYVDLREEISLGEGLQELVEQLGRKLRANTNEIPTQEALTARWIRNLVIWLIDQINRSGHFWWFVFDSINQVEGLPNEIHDFIVRLARQLEIEEFDPPCRLVLISYQGREQLPPEIGLRVVQDEIRNEVGPAQMQGFFEEQIRLLLGEDANDDEVQATTATLCDVVRSKLNALPEGIRPYAISSMVSEALRELEASLVVEEAPE